MLKTPPPFVPCCMHWTAQLGAAAAHVLPRCGQPRSAQPVADSSLRGNKVLQYPIFVCESATNGVEAIPELPKAATLSDYVRVGALHAFRCLMGTTSSERLSLPECQCPRTQIPRARRCNLK